MVALSAVGSGSAPLLVARGTAAAATAAGEADAPAGDGPCSLESWVCAWADRLCRVLGGCEMGTPHSSACGQPTGAGRELERERVRLPMSARSASASEVSPGGLRLDAARALRLSLQAILPDGAPVKKPRRRPRPQAGRVMASWDRLDEAPLPEDQTGVVGALLRVERAMQPFLQSLTGVSFERVSFEHFSPRSCIVEGLALDSDYSGSPTLWNKQTVQLPAVAVDSEAPGAAASASRPPGAPPPSLAKQVAAGSSQLSPRGAAVVAGRPRSSPVVPKLSLSSAHRGAPAAAAMPDCPPGKAASAAGRLGAVDPALEVPSAAAAPAQPQALPAWPGLAAGKQSVAAAATAAMSTVTRPHAASDGVLLAGPGTLLRASVQARALRVAGLLEQVQRCIDMQHEVLTASEVPCLRPQPPDQLQSCGPCGPPPVLKVAPPLPEESDSSEESSDSDLTKSSPGGSGRRGPLGGAAAAAAGDLGRR